jgi:hypothetical protein
MLRLAMHGEPDSDDLIPIFLGDATHLLSLKKQL